MDEKDPGAAEEPIGSYLRRARMASGLTLRDVEGRTDGSIKSGYLSQLEQGLIRSPSPSILWRLGEVYGLDYAELLIRSGHHVPREMVPERNRAVHGIPLHALESLDAEDRRALVDYIAYLQSRKKRG